MKCISPWITIVFAAILLYSLSACSIDTTKPVTRTSAYPRVIERAKKDNRYFIMSSGVDTFVVSSVLLEKKKQQFTVHLDRLDSIHKVHINNPKALNEKRIHLYLQDSASYTLDEPHTIPLSKVERIELVE
jgi:hypothetical protein